MRPFTTSALLIVLLTCPGTAQTPKTADDEAGRTRSGGITAPASRIKSRGDSSQDNLSQWEYWTNVTIPASSWVILDSQLDYSTADTVRMTIRSTKANLDNVTVAAYWAIPEVPYYGIADVLEGSKFVYLDAGGATLNTYGSHFRIQVINNSRSAITLSQVLLFTRSHIY